MVDQSGDLHPLAASDINQPTAMNDLKGYSEKANELLFTYGPKALMALVVLLVGLWLINMLGRAMVRVLKKRDVDDSLIPFLRALCTTLLKVMLVISVVQMVGIQTTSFIAVLGAAGLAIGMALSGTLQNFAGGVMILIFKPFKVGDMIESQGHTGTVKAIRIFNTVLNTVDNKTVILPNAPVSTDSLVNYSTENTRRIDLKFGIGYAEDIDRARAAVNSVIGANGRILKDPESQVLVSELADSSVKLEVRVWVNTADYWDVYFATIEQVKKRFDAERITIPFPQMDVRTKAV